MKHGFLSLSAVFASERLFRTAVLCLCCGVVGAQAAPTDAAVASTPSAVSSLPASAAPSGAAPAGVLAQAVLREAVDKGWADRPEVKARVDAATRELAARVVVAAFLESVGQVPSGYPSDAEVGAAYEQAKSGFQLPTAYRMAQIFLAAPADDAVSVARVREAADMAAREARAGDFGSVARLKSQDKASAQRGGEIGALPLARVLPELRETIAGLQPGQVSDPVRTPDGFHVVKLLEVLPARLATLEEIKPQLQAALRQRRQQQLVQEHLAQLVPAAPTASDVPRLKTP